MTRLRGVLLVAALALGLGACSEEEAPAPLPVRAIKHMTVSERASDQLRRIAGLVRAGTTTNIAFEIAGQVTALPVGIGDGVRQGEQIGRLDTERYELKLETSRGELQNAEAQLRDAQKKYDQQKKLHDKGFATKTAYDSSLATLESARSKVEIARSQLAIARRDVQKTVLVSPFDGRVSAKYVEVFTEVSAGQKILQLHTEGDFEVVASVPETLIRSLEIGDAVDVTFTSLGGDDAQAPKTTTGKITEIGSQATAANAFQVIARLDDQVPDVRPGMTAQVTFHYETEATGKAFLLPMSALLPGSEARNAHVYVYDEAAGVVRKRPVRVTNIRNNDLEVLGELKAGDIVATAGVSFLSDGMKVRLMERASGN